MDALFREDLLEVPENQGFFRDMVGLGEHTPFECIGQVDESRLALHLCGARGLLGSFGRELLRSLPPLTLEATLETYTQVDEEHSRLPVHLAGPLLAQMRAAASRCHDHIRAVLS